MVVVGGGPSGVEYAAELHDFLTEDLVSNSSITTLFFLILTNNTI
jgi:NADH dehydrogenase FAD-containing subunit